MTVYAIVSIRDRQAGVFSRPAFVPSEGAAIRSFGDEINRAAPDNEMNRHPDDFDLFLLGHFNDNEGTFQTGQPQQLVVGKNLKL